MSGAVEALDEATDAVQAANDTFGRAPSPQTRAALTAAFHAYARCLSPVIGHAAALKYEASWMTYHAAIGTKNEAAAWDVFEGGRVALGAALENAQARDHELVGFSQAAVPSPAA